MLSSVYPMSSNDKDILCCLLKHAKFGSANRDGETSGRDEASADGPIPVIPGRRNNRHYGIRTRTDGERELFLSSASSNDVLYAFCI